jgi:hypothetical protein
MLVVSGELLQEIDCHTRRNGISAIFALNVLVAWGVYAALTRVIPLMPESPTGCGLIYFIGFVPYHLANIVVMAYRDECLSLDVYWVTWAYGLCSMGLVLFLGGTALYRHNYVEPLAIDNPVAAAIVTIAFFTGYCFSEMTSLLSLLTESEKQKKGLAHEKTE